MDDKYVDPFSADEYLDLDRDDTDENGNPIAPDVPPEVWLTDDQLPPVDWTPILPPYE